MVRRYDYLEALVAEITDDELLVTNLGQTRNDLQSIRSDPPSYYSLNLGQCLPFGIGLATALPHRQVLSLDGDGNLLLNLASLSDWARESPPNLIEIVLNNRVYQSAGELPSATSDTTDLATIAKGAGIENAFEVESVGEFQDVLREALESEEPYFIDATIDDLESPVDKPPTLDGKEIKYNFIRHIEESEGIEILDPL